MDNLDKLLARWPLALFHNMVDVSVYNAFMLWRELNLAWMFLERLGEELVVLLATGEEEDHDNDNVDNDDNDDGGGGGGGSGSDSAERAAKEEGNGETVSSELKKRKIC